MVRISPAKRPLDTVQFAIKRSMYDHPFASQFPPKTIGSFQLVFDNIVVVIDCSLVREHIKGGRKGKAGPQLKETTH